MMNIAIRINRWVSAVVGAAALATAGVALAADPAALSPPVKIRVNTAGLAGEGGLFLAYDRGYFHAEGLQVELIDSLGTNSSMDTLTQLATGSLDMGTFAPTAALFNAVHRGIGLVGLLPMNTVSKSEKSSGIVVRQDHITSGRYKGVQDLKGMKIAVLTLGGSGHYNVLRALESAGLKGTDVEIATMSFPDALVALGSKSIDAAFEVEPFISAAGAKGIGTLAIPAAQTSLGAPTIALFTSSQFANKNPEATKRFVAALLRGQRDYEAAVKAGGAPREELLKSLQRHTSLKDLARLREMNLPSVDPNGGYEPAVLRSVQEFYIKTGVQSKMVDPVRVFDRTYVDYAVSRLDKR